MFLSGPIILVSNAVRPGMDPAWSGWGGGCIASSGREFNYLSCDHHYDHQITENIYIRYSYYKIGTLQVDLLDH